ncbi:MAG: enoyl-CoA hydratase-related protein [Pseudomonadota bacterium]
MTVHTDKTDDVWTIIHDRPEARNAMDPAHSQPLFEAIKDFERGPAKVAVLWGKGPHFCAGWDLKFAATLADPVLREAEFDDLAFPVGSAPFGRGRYGTGALV